MATNQKMLPCPKCGHTDFLAVYGYDGAMYVECNNGFAVHDIGPVDTEIDTGTRWRHRKGGEYTVIAVARIEADLSPVIVYRSDADGRSWVRPLAEFEDGRFTQITDVD